MFSIIIPVYNVEKYIERCLESVINQTVKPFEVILVDDGSEDDSSEICKKISKKYEFIKYYQKENGGLSDARNFGLLRATGDYIIFLDSDDTIENDTIRILTSTLKDNKEVEIIIGNAIKIEAGKEKKMSNGFDQEIMEIGINYYYDSMKKDSFLVPTWIHIFNRKFLLNNNLLFTKNLLHEDEDHTPRCLLVAKTVLVTDIYFYNYYIRENSITTSPEKLNQRGKDLVTIYKSLLTKIKELDNKKLEIEFQNFWLGIFLDYQYKMRNSKFINQDILDEVKKIKPLRKNKVKLKVFLFSKRLYFILLSIKNHQNKGS